jgi:DNA helicase HerA-like ATPase
MKMIHLSKGLSLPLDFVTQAAAILAKRRVGKSYTARRIVEQLLGAGQQIIILDPKGDWWGIRSAADGVGPGLQITILGGEHGDAALHADAGEAVARIAVEEGVSLLLDLSELRKHEVATFAAAFMETLYRMKAKEIYRTPVMVVVDEGDAIAPQRPQPNEARMLGAAEDLVRRGGQRGIGTMFITQRSAVLNKNVLTQVQVLIALRTIAPQDLKAMDEWIDVHGEPEQRKALMASLPSLPVGEAWVWAPGWPTETGIFQRVKVSPIETFDSGKTPAPGEKRIEPRLVSAVDLDRIRDLLADATQRDPEDNPKTLKKRIAELEKELAARPAGNASRCRCSTRISSASSSASSRCR